jgi:Protein of unknown function (DUF1329)
MFRANFLFSIVTAALLAAFIGTAAAQDLGTFNEKLIDQLLPANSTETLAPGTKITTANWQQYAKFMPIGMQAFMSGRFFWHIGTGPGDYAEVGPTIATPLPYKYLQDTEKYGNQAKLVKQPSGSYWIQNYVAGIPFPNPSEPDMGAKLLYNYYYTYIPTVYHSYYPVAFIDRYFNITSSVGQQMFYKLSHVSDADQPITNPGANHLYLSLYDQEILPEQTKYLTSMAIYPDDPQRDPELYVFLPSLRRSLRLSSAARCSPLQGTDWTNDDQRGGFSGIPDWFIPRYLGEKKLLFVVHSSWLSTASEDRKYVDGYTYGGSASGWVKPQGNPFEFRDVYLLDLVPIADRAKSYCYSHRLLYIDKNMAYTADFADTWDQGEKLYKLQIIFRGPTNKVPLSVNGHNTFVLPSGGELGLLYDVQNDHASVAWPSSPPEINAAVPAQFHNIQLYALPSGLDQIGK